jgi:hypothetical protein
LLYSKSRIAFRRAAFTSLAALRPTGSRWFSAAVPVASGSLHEGQRFANPGLPGLSSNSSEQMTQILIGNGICFNVNADPLSLLTALPVIWDAVSAQATG